MKQELVRTTHREDDTSNNATGVTSVLGEMSSLLLGFGLLSASCLSQANGHMMPAYCCVDVHMEGSVEQTLHPLQKACHLQHTSIVSIMLLY